MSPSSTATNSQPPLHKIARWPIVVVTLLLGHVLLMMVAVVWARTIPAAVTTVESSAPSIEQHQPSP